MFSTQSQSFGISKIDSTFISTMWSFFGMAILIAGLGAWSGGFIVQNVGLMVPYIAFIGMMFTSGFWIQSKTFKLPMFVLFAFLSGTMLYPTLAFAGATGQIGAIIQAFISAGATFFAAAIFGYTTQKDLSGWGNFLFMAMIGLFTIGMLSLLGSVFNIAFLTFGSTFSYIYSAISVLLFTAFTCYDIQNIKNGMYSSPLMAAFHMYFNLFVIVQNMLNLFLDRD